MKVKPLAANLHQAFEHRFRRRRAWHGLIPLAVVACFCSTRQGEANVVTTYAAISHAAEEVSIPLAAIFIGSLGRSTGITSLRTASMLSVYFGAQTGMLLLSKILISRSVVSEELGLYGLPAAFLMTALHQTIAFVLFGTIFLISQLTPWPYTPKPLTKMSDLWWLLLFSATFAANIGLNNVSFQFLPLSLNLIVRSCLPIATVAMQMCLPSKMAKAQTAWAKELVCMLAGVSCAALATVAQSLSTARALMPGHQIGLGVAICIVSDFAGALNMVLANELGNRLKLSPLDITFYMSPPAAVILLVPSMLMNTPSWPEEPYMTDWEVFSRVYETARGVLGFASLLGIFATAYNVLQFEMAQSLSATYTTFAGNFNKATTVMISLAIGLEHLPQGVWGLVMLLATLGNIASFTGYSLLQLRSAS